MLLFRKNEKNLKPEERGGFSVGSAVLGVVYILLAVPAVYATYVAAIYIALASRGVLAPLIYIAPIFVGLKILVSGIKTLAYGRRINSEVSLIGKMKIMDRPTSFVIYFFTILLFIVLLSFLAGLSLSIF